MESVRLSLFEGTSSSYGAAFFYSLKQIFCDSEVGIAVTLVWIGFSDSVYHSILISFICNSSRTLCSKAEYAQNYMVSNFRI